ncbi:MAG: hypothetical protein K6A43_04165 [Treponema sp.]|nr:hypothetical protein [Treponema sp.]
MKKLILSIITLISITTAVFALPGFTSFIPDNSGEYVFYRDKSFERESYIGLLCYNDSTYEIKYVSPKNEILGQPEKELALLIKVNPESDYFDMIGEKVISTVDYGSDDVDILNYMHDFLYEFSAKRISKDTVTTREETSSHDFPLFGGNVTFIYDCVIPLFNLRSVLDQSGNAILECCTIGQVSSSHDTSFEDFRGFTSIPVVTPANSTAAAKKDKKSGKNDGTTSKSDKKSDSGTSSKSKAKTQKFTFENQTVVMDSDWEQQMENIWTLQNDSIVTVSEIPLPNEDLDLSESYLIRKLSESSQGRYTDFATMEIIKNKKGQYKITSISHESNGKDSIRTVKLLTPSSAKDKFAYFSISTYNSAYQKNTVYFDKIVNGYRAK